MGFSEEQKLFNSLQKALAGIRNCSTFVARQGKKSTV